MKHNKLRQLREQEKVSGAVIADKLGVTPQYYYDLETGRRRLNEDLLIKLADIHDVSVDYLLGRTEEKNGLLTAKESRGSYTTLAKRIESLPDAEKRIIEIIISSSQNQSAGLE